MVTAAETLIAGFNGDVDTGTFTFTPGNSNGLGTDGYSLKIPHNLGKTPRLIAFFPEDLPDEIPSLSAIAYSCMNFGETDEYQPDGTPVLAATTSWTVFSYTNSSPNTRSEAMAGDWYDTEEFFSIPRAGVTGGNQRHYLTGVDYRWIVAA